MKTRTAATARATTVRLLLAAGMAAVLSACSTAPAWLPNSGPSREQVEEAATSPSDRGIQIVEVNDTVARRVLASQRQSLFSEVFGASEQPGYVIGAGDVIEVSVWEAPP